MKQWYLLVYDVREPRRLRRLHYALKKKALPMQESVFLVHADSARLKSIIEMVKDRTHTREDDVRLYPLKHPDDMWMGGCQQQAMSGLFPGKASKGSVTVLDRIRNLFGR